MKTLLIWLLRLSTVDRRDPIWFQKFCMIFMIDVMIWFSIWFPPWVFDGFVNFTQRHSNYTSGTDCHNTTNNQQPTTQQQQKHSVVLLREKEG